MYIRRTTIKSRQNGEPYFTHRLVESVRTPDGVRQRTLLNLGKHFSYPQELWPVLAQRIEQLITGQGSLYPVNQEIEADAQRYAAQLIGLRSHSGMMSEQHATPDITDHQSVDVNTVEVLRPRSVSIEYVALSILRELGLDTKLKSLGLNTPQLHAAIGLLVGRMAAPGSELATHTWLQENSGLGELLGWDFCRTSLTRLYQVSDQLLKHKEALETFLYEREQALFYCEDTITLYDLTNTYFEGNAKGNDLAKRGRSKENRSDCPLVTLGLVLDSSGFPKRSRVFAGNASEPGTLANMLAGLGEIPNVRHGDLVPEEQQDGQKKKQGQLVFRAPTTVVMDAGIATEANLAWLVENGYHYLVVSRKRHREFIEEESVIVKDGKDGRVRVCRVVNGETGEIELYCHSERREEKEEAILDLFSQRFELAMKKLADGLLKKTGCKEYDKIQQRIGRIREKYARASQYYEVTVETARQEEGKQNQSTAQSAKVTKITWERTEKSQTALAHPGVYCLRTNQAQWDEVTLWNTFTMLTNLEAVFRSLKTELGLRPVFHQNEDRVSGHLFISVLAYHLVHGICCRLKIKKIHHSWDQLRRLLQGQVRITISMKLEDGRQLHLRKSSRPELRQQLIYDALGLPHHPGKIEKTFV